MAPREEILQDIVPLIKCYNKDGDGLELTYSASNICIRPAVTGHFGGGFINALASYCKANSVHWDIIATNSTPYIQI